MNMPTPPFLGFLGLLLCAMALAVDTNGLTLTAVGLSCSLFALSMLRNPKP